MTDAISPPQSMAGKLGVKCMALDGFRFSSQRFLYFITLEFINFVLSTNPVSFSTILKVNQCGGFLSAMLYLWAEAAIR